MKWITREDIKVDRVACPWLIRRFVDAEAQFLFVPESELLETAARKHAIPFDAPKLSAVKLNHGGEPCSFEALIEDYHLSAAFSEVAWARCSSAFMTKENDNANPKHYVSAHRDPRCAGDSSQH